MRRARADVSYLQAVLVDDVKGEPVRMYNAAALDASDFEGRAADASQIASPRPRPRARVALRWTGTRRTSVQIKDRPQLPRDRETRGPGSLRRRPRDATPTPEVVSPPRGEVYSLESSLASPREGAETRPSPTVRSLDARHISQHLAGGFLVADEAPSSDAVAAADWDLLLAMYGVDKVGLLLVDAEGFDCKLLLAFPFHVLRPNVITLEHAHCDGPFSKDGDPSTWVLMNRTRALLAAYEYVHVDATEDGDSTFIRADILPPVDVARPGFDAFLERSTFPLYENGRCKRRWLEWGARWGP